MTPVSISIVAITAAAMASLSVGQSAPGGAATPLDQQAQPSATQSDSVRVDSGGVLAPQQGRPDSIPTPRWEQPSRDDFKLGASRTYKFIYFVGVLAAGSVGLMVFLLIASYRRRKAESESMPLMLAPMPINAALITSEFPSQTNHVPLPQPLGENSNDSRESVSVRMPKPPEGTLQLLPGRLEIASGNDRMKEIRFVKMPGPTVVTFGRYAGEGHSHIQVDSPTVSRLHARMRFEGGRWHITNLSSTNPVVLNGQPLPADENEQVLNDSDQVEMGEVVFRFRSR